MKKKYLFSWFYFLLLIGLISLEALFWLKKTGFFYREPQYEVNLFPDFKIAIPETSDSAQVMVELNDVANYVSAEAFFVIDNTTQTIILEKNPQLPLPPASTTKLMTVYTALKNYDLNAVVSVSTTAALDNDGGDFYPLEKVKVKDLAAAALVSSANDAAYALADNYPGGYNEFLAKMNSSTKQLHLDSTRFGNVVGYDYPENISTAHDLAMLTMAVFKEKPISEWMSTKNYVVEDQSLTRRHFLLSTNELLGGKEGVIAGKTGTTPLAKEVLVSVAELDGHQYIVAIMGSDARYQDTKFLLEWLRTNLQWQTVEFPLQIK